MTPKTKRAQTKTTVAKSTKKTAAKKPVSKKNPKTTNLAGEIGILGWIVVAGVMVYLGWLATNVGIGPK